MPLIAYIFLIFLSITTLIYYLVPKRMQWGVILLANMVFYGYAGLKFLLLLIATTAVVYYFSMQMQKNLDQMEEAIKGVDRRTARKIRMAGKKERKKYLVWGLVIVIGILVIFKGLSFILDNIGSICTVFGLPAIPHLNIAAPMGISFYSFMLISYLVDLYNGHISAQKNFLKYLTYATYFPHITQGPIARYEEVGHQIYEEHRFDYDAFLKGTWLIMWGAVKKMVIADRLSGFVTEVFGNAGSYKGLIFLLAGVLYSIQIYCDFSGCMDIVRGASECLGIRLQENFLRPYFSETLPEFWRRWHATLGAFFREYVFYPVSTSGLFLKLNNNARAKLGNFWGQNLASMLPILSVWLLTGVWHGANWNYIGWGLFHGILICCSTAFEQPLDQLTKKLHIPTNAFLWKVYRILRTFFLCVIGRIIFMGDGLAGSFRMLGSCIADAGVHYDLLHDFTLNWKSWSVVLFYCVVLFVASFIQERLQKSGREETIRDILIKSNFVLRWIVLLAGIMSVLLFGVYGDGVGASFIYEQF